MIPTQPYYNYNHKLHQVPLVVRSLYIWPALLLVVLSHSLLFFLFNTLTFISLSLFISRVRIINIIKFYQTPSLFILLGCITIAINIDFRQDVTQNTFPYFILGNIEWALFIFFRGFAILSIIIFGMLTHSISEISRVMESIKIPTLFIELFTLTYKFIFNLNSIASNMHTAQKLRLAYIQPGTKYKAFSMLALGVFRRSIQKTEQLHIALDARLGSQAIKFIGQEYRYKAKQLVLPFVVILILFISYLILQPINEFHY